MPAAVSPTAPARAVRPAPTLAVLEAANGPVRLQQADRVSGTLLVGGQGAGKSSALLRLALSDAMDPDSAVILIDPKSEVSRKFLQLIKPEWGRRVWYLDLARPAFGMSPLAMSGDQDFASEASAIADGVVESLLDVNAGQIMQASRDLLMRCVMGALAVGHDRGRPAYFEDVYTMLLPTEAGADARKEAWKAADAIPNMGPTAQFFREELPARLERSTSSTVDRLQAPSNKIAGIVGVPALRTFLGHPVDIPMKTIVENRDILIVTASMDKVGEANAQAMLHFIFRQLHRQMQRQVHLPEGERPRVALLCDEFHYLASRNVVKQIATHRAAGLDVTAGLQFFSQLGAGAESASVTQEIREGVLNLMQSRFLFRLGHPQDAEAATRIAMAVYQSMLRSDPDSRAQMRVTPEAILNLPRFHCLASWISNGTRAASFIGRTFPMPEASNVWADMHLQAQARRGCTYPEDLMEARMFGLRDEIDSDRTPPLNITAETDVAIEALGLPTPPTTTTVPAAPAPRRPNSAPTVRDSGNNDVLAEPAPEHAEIQVEPAAATAGKPRAPRQMTVDDMLAADAEKDAPTIYRPDPADVPRLQDSRVRTLFGNQPRGQAALFEEPRDPDAEAPESLRDLAFIDRVNEVSDRLEVVDDAPAIGRLYGQDLTVLKFLDRAGVALPLLIRAAAMPGKSESQARRTMGKLHKHGLVGKRKIGIRDRTREDGQLPSAYELSRAGFELAQERGFIPEKREYRSREISRDGKVPHDHHALGWYIALHRLIGDVATDHWRTPRYATGRFPLPQVGNGHKRRPLQSGDIHLPTGFTVFDVDDEAFREIKPDVTAELEVKSVKLTFDLLVEYHHARNHIDNNDDKFPAYDAFLTGWALEHTRFKQLGTRPVVVFVAADAKDLLTLTRKADEAMVASIGLQGSPAQSRYYAGRDHIFFALEEDVHRGNLSAVALPPQPPALRARLGDESLQLKRVALLPPSMTVAAQRKAKRRP